jgi:single-strand DNA-binding protein
MQGMILFCYGIPYPYKTGGIRKSSKAFKTDRGGIIMINKITLVGRLTKDVEIRKAGEKSVANYQLASQRPYKKEGEKPTDFISVVSWGNDADFLAKNSKKGAMVAITGRLETRNYDHPQHGIKIYVNEINTDEVQLLDWNENQASNNQSGAYQQPYNPGGQQQPPQQAYNPAGNQYNQQPPNYSQQPPGGQQAYQQQPPTQQYQQPPQQQTYQQQQPPAYNQQPPAQQQYQQQPPPQQNYRRVDEDPFAPGNNQGPPNNLLVSDEDLPF